MSAQPRRYLFALYPSPEQDAVLASYSGGNN